MTYMSGLESFLQGSKSAWSVFGFWISTWTNGGVCILFSSVFGSFWTVLYSPHTNTKLQRKCQRASIIVKVLKASKLPQLQISNSIYEHQFFFMPKKGRKNLTTKIFWQYASFLCDCHCMVQYSQVLCVNILSVPISFLNSTTHLSTALLSKTIFLLRKHNLLWSHVNPIICEITSPGASSFHFVGNIAALLGCK